MWWQTAGDKQVWMRSTCGLVPCTVAASGSVRFAMPSSHTYRTLSFAEVMAFTPWWTLARYACSKRRLAAEAPVSSARSLPTVTPCSYASQLSEG